MATETDETKKCMDRLGELGIKVTRKNTGAVAYNKPCPRCKCRPSKGPTRFVRFGKKGDPDLSGYVPGGNARPFFWEVKKEGGVPSAEQRKFIDKAISDGCYAGIGGLMELDRYLNEVGLI